ncbi:hypothetical protein NERG_00609 [Nematocida ausubeli]|uniref:Uncharacterized protein n=1 Tax=Nematocida ausubeli (strain ATCC PRA-371 / ERTm2) TaxID=1913371 RepID=H8ZAL0_NEMA1|nr:hypothetical protein NERG_00609 [Nematocida ausubeli]
MISRLLLSLVMLQSILARISVKDIKTVSETFVGEKQDVVINPRGPLNLLRGYIGNRSGHMYNKRFYSSEIDTDYALSKKRLSSIGEQEYNFKRKPVNDRVHKDMDTKTPEGKYLSSYHAQLIKMFPSADGDLSIEAGRSNALTNFLRADHVKKDTKYILAALLLLSEGVDIKIAVDCKGKKNNLVIKSKTCKEKVFVNVVMHTAGIDPFTNEHSENIYQSEAAGIVKFYMQCKDNSLLKRGGEFAMPATREQFESGKFLNNAAFLIQTYIYEFIDTAESYKDFVNAVHELLVDQVTNKENPEQTKKKDKNRRIFDKLFLAKEELSENIKYTEKFYSFIKTISENTKFPFYNANQLPKYTRVPRCKLDKSGFEKDQALYYSDCVETALLGLFCCLAYNPETGEYETSHMGEGVSDELRDFFEKYSKPTETTDFEMHKQWSKVIACLKDEKIDYVQSRNELFPGLENIFLVISEITGQKADILELVECIENVCRTGELDDKQEVYIADKIESIIKSLSKNKNVKVECSRMKLGKTSNSKVDILAEINITYTFSKVSNGISLDIKKGHANLVLLPSSKDNSESIKEKYEEVKNTYSGIDCYIGYIMNQYASVESYFLNTSCAVFSINTKKILDQTIQGESEGISRIFLLGKISAIEIKRSIINSFIFNTIDKKIDPKSTLTRFTANILGSVPLNDPETRYLMLKYFIFYANWQEFYPRLGFKPSENIPKEDIIWNVLKKLNLRKNTPISLPAPISLKATCNYLRSTANDPRMNDSRVDFITRKSLLHFIVSNGMIDKLVEIQSIIKESTEDYNLNYVYVFWLTYACSDVSKFTLESIKTVYNFIVVDNYPEPFLSKELIILEPSKYIENCLNTLKENKRLFCSKHDRESMEKYDVVLSYFLKTCSWVKKSKCAPCTIS